MNKKIKAFGAGVSLFLLLNGCVQNYYYYPNTVEEEPTKSEEKLETKAEEQMPSVFETKTLEEKTIEQKTIKTQEKTEKQEKEYFYLNVPGKETIYETGIYYVIAFVEKCIQDARKSRKEGNERFPYYVWDFKPVKNNPLRGVGIGSSLVTIDVNGDTCVVGMSKEKAQEVVEVLRSMCCKEAYISPLR